jgi:F-type H+-transporting ATPase subunit alpha
MAQYQELQAFLQFGSDLDVHTRHRLERGKRMVELLKQSIHQSRVVEFQVALLWAAQHEYFDQMEVEKMPDIIADLSGHFEHLQKEWVDQLHKAKALGPALTKQLKQIFDNWQQTKLCK